MKSILFFASRLVNSFLPFLLATFLFTLIFFVTGCKTTTSYKSNKGITYENNRLKGVETTEIEVKGFSQITESGEQDAYDRALEHGFRKAVEKVLGTLIQSETLVKNSILIEDKIVAKNRGFVQKYQVLSERNQGKTKTLSIKVWVAKGDIQKDVRSLGLLNERAGRPTLMVLINETMMNDQPSTMTRGLIYDFFKEKKFRFVDISKMSKNQESTSDETVKTWAVKQGAQVVVIGDVYSEEQEVSHFKDTGFKSVRSKIEIRVIYAGDGEVIASKTFHSAGTGLNIQTAQNSSIEKATKKINPALLEAIINHWDKASNEGFEYEIRVIGISFEEAQTIKDAIESKIEGVKNVFEKGYRNNMATYLVKYTGLANQLGKMLTLSRKTEVPLKLMNYNVKSIQLKRRQ